jgi:hypothetical protein
LKKYIDYFPIVITKKDVILKAIENDVYWLSYASKKLLKDYEVALKAVKINGDSLFLIDKKIIDNRLIIESMKENPFNFKYLDNKYKDNKFIVWNTFKIYPYILEFASDRIKKDIGFSKQTSKYFSFACLYFCNNSYKDNELREIVTSKEKCLSFLFNFHSVSHSGRFKDKNKDELNKLVEIKIEEVVEVSESKESKNESINNEVSMDSLLKLNEKNKELLKESAITKEDNKLSIINSNNNNNEKENTKENTKKEEVKTTTHKQR